MRFRPLSYLPHLLVFLLLAVGVMAALATRFPEAEILERAERWPAIGPLAKSFRRLYLPPRPGRQGAGETAPGESPALPEVEVIQVIDPDMLGVKPKVWARPGTPIYEERDLASREMGRVEHLFPLSLLARDGDWFRVRYGSRLSGLSKGWVHLPGYVAPTEEELAAPAPVLPLAPVAIRSEALDAARRSMGEGVDGQCGPYRRLTDVDDPEVLALCERVGSRIERAFRRRYGLDPVGAAAETILLFAEQREFDAFRAELEPGAVGEAFASPAAGYVAVPVAERRLGRIEATLIHELAHLLNRRALGPALPPWLNEGIARDLDTVGVDPPAGGSLRRAGAVESLELLIDLDEAAFRLRAEQHYRAAGRWIGFLVAGGDPALAAGMRGFLSAVATGEPIGAALLLDHLDSDWPDLERRFRAWESGSRR